MIRLQLICICNGVWISIFQMGASVPASGNGNMYQAMNNPAAAAAMFNPANMVTMANNMPAQMLPPVNQQAANTGHLPQHPSQQVSAFYSSSPPHRTENL